MLTRCTLIALTCKPKPLLFECLQPCCYAGGRRAAHHVRASKDHDILGPLPNAMLHESAHANSSTYSCKSASCMPTKPAPLHCATQHACPLSLCHTARLPSFIVHHSTPVPLHCATQRACSPTLYHTACLPASLCLTARLPPSLCHTARLPQASQKCLCLP